MTYKLFIKHISLESKGFLAKEQKCDGKGARRKKENLL